jgi:hypothetical protein
MFGLGGASEEELSSLRKACKAHMSAYVGCKAANQGFAAPCVNLETSVLACLAGKVCEKERAAFDQCSQQSHTKSTTEGRLRIYDDANSCQKQIAAMRKCLGRTGVWPKLE